MIERLAAGGREYDEELLRSVHEYAGAMHAGQKRQSGEPFYNHPLQVAYLTADAAIRCGACRESGRPLWWGICAWCGAEEEEFEEAA